MSLVLQTGSGVGAAEGKEQERIKQQRYALLVQFEKKDCSRSERYHLSTFLVCLHV